MTPKYTFCHQNNTLNLRTGLSRIFVCLQLAEHSPNVNTRKRFKNEMCVFDVSCALAKVWGEVRGEMWKRRGEVGGIDFFIFIFLSRESGGGTMHRTIPDSLRSCLSFLFEFSSEFFNLLLARFHQANIIIVKHLIQGRNNVTRLGVEPLTLLSWSS